MKLVRIEDAWVNPEQVCAVVEDPETGSGAQVLLTNGSVRLKTSRDEVASVLEKASQ
jgi:hypothetical protein